MTYCKTMEKKCRFQPDRIFISTVSSAVYLCVEGTSTSRYIYHSLWLINLFFLNAPPTALSIYLYAEPYPRFVYMMQSASISVPSDLCISIVTLRCLTSCLSLMQKKYILEKNRKTMQRVAVKRIGFACGFLV